MCGLAPLSARVLVVFTTLFFVNINNNELVQEKNVVLVDCWVLEAQPNVCWPSSRKDSL